MVKGLCWQPYPWGFPLSTTLMNTKVEKVVKMMSSVDQHLVHGRQIDGATARSELHLNVKLLAKDDPFGNIKSGKMFESHHEMLSAKLA